MALCSGRTVAAVSGGGRRKYSMAAVGVLTRWCLGLSALYLMSSGGSMILCANLVSSSSHHGRHHNHHHRPVSMSEAKSSPSVDSLEYGGAQLEKSLLETTSKRPALHHQLQCPQCMHAGEFYSEKTAASSIGVNNPIDSETIRLEAIKEQILNKLGLKSKPIVSKKLPKEVVLQSLYRAEEDRENVDGGDWSQQQSTDSVTTTQRVANSAAVPAADAAPGSGAEIDDFYARTSEIITFAEEGSFLNEQRLVEFAYSDAGEVSGQELRIKAATLWVKVDFHRSVPATKRRLAHDKNVTLWVFRVLGHAPADLFANNNARFTSQEFDKYTEMSASIPVSLASLGWQKFDMTTTVRDWYTQKPKKHHGRLRLLIDCSGCKHLVQLHLFTKDAAGPSRHYDTYRYKYAPDKDSLSSGEQQEEEAAAVRNESRFYGGEGSMYDSTSSSAVDDTNRPFLVIHTDPNVMRRVRRRALDCSGALKGQCCKQRFYVNFTNLGWDDWIIAPNGYYANYCKGDCGGAHRTPDTFLNYYTHVIEEYKKYGDLKGLQPCCAPMKFSSMSLIYFGPDSNIIKRDLPKMVVDECGCP